MEFAVTIELESEVTIELESEVTIELEFAVTIELESEVTIELLRRTGLQESRKVVFELAAILSLVGLQGRRLLPARKWIVSDDDVE